MVSEQTEASMTGPRAMKTPGDPLWCWQTVSALETMWKDLDLDAVRYSQIWAEAEEHKVWEKIPYDKPYGTKEAMLEALGLGDDAQARLRVAENAVAAVPLQPNGGVRRGDQYSGHNTGHQPVNGRSQNTKYLSARIARDRPDIWERMKRGEFKSVAEAARAAGINIPKHKRVVVNGNVEKLAKSIREALGPEDFARFVDCAMCLSADAEEERADG